MKQLVSKRDKRLRLVGLEDAAVEGDLIRFRTPEGVCVWSARSWEVQDYRRRAQAAGAGEPPLFCSCLRGAIEVRGYSASGLGVVLGKSKGWLSMVLTGKRRLPERYDAAVERELALERGTLAAWRTERSRTPTI